MGDQKPNVATSLLSVVTALVAYTIVSGIVDYNLRLPWYVRAWDNAKEFVNEYGIVIPILLLLAGGIVRFAYWGNHPSIVSASVFWAIATTYGILFIITATNIYSRIAWIIMRIGGTLNMIVTLANGGVMPIIGGEEPAHGIWVVANESHRLLFLADRFWGLSLGDLVMLGGIAFLVASLLAKIFADRDKVAEDAALL